MKDCCYLMFILLFSCKQEIRKDVVTIKKDNLIIEGDITNDTIASDTIRYYNLDHQLLSVKVLRYGKINGEAVEMYGNGAIMKSTMYENGYKNGINTYFDSLGKIFYRDFYYFDLIVGPVIFFNSDGSPKRYFFANLQNETLIDIDYSNWKGIKNVYENCINFTVNTLKEDTSKKIHLFIYLLNPPKFNFEYSLLKKKKISDNDYTEVQKVSNDFPFKAINLPILPNDEHYVVGLNIFDSSLNKETLIYKDL